MELEDRGLGLCYSLLKVVLMVSVLRVVCWRWGAFIGVGSKIVC